MKCLAAAVIFAASATAARAADCTPKVPAADLVQAGTLMMSINPTLPPQQYVNSQGELEGLNVELGRDIAARLCLKPVFVRMDMPPMIPGLRAGRFDMINTGLFWTEERSKMLFMVPYAQQAISVYTSPNSTLQIKSFDDLAGLTVGVETATYQERTARTVSADMAKRGLKAIDFRTFDNVTETSAALRAGQLQAGINIDETAKALAAKNIAKIWLHGLFGTEITIDFRNKTLAEAAAQALTEIKTDGTYDKLFAKFEMTPVNLSTFAIRGPGPS